MEVPTRQLLYTKQQDHLLETIQGLRRGCPDSLNHFRPLQGDLLHYMGRPFWISKLLRHALRAVRTRISSMLRRTLECWNLLVSVLHLALIPVRVSSKPLARQATPAVVNIAPL